MLGAETAFLNNKFEAYQDRHILQKQYNDAVRKYANNRENVTVLDVNQYITGQDSFYKHINHFVPRVYCEMAQDMVKLINQWTGMEVVKESRLKALRAKLKFYVRKALHKM